MKLPHASDFGALSFLCGLILVISWDRLRESRELSTIDNPTFFLPWLMHLGDRLRVGDIPGWLPAVFSGVPFAGDPQSGWMYLPSMVIFALLPSLMGFKVFIVFHLILAGVGTYLYGRTLRLGALGSLVAAVAYALGPFLKYSNGWVGFIQVAVWFPVSLIGCELAIRATSWRRKVVGWSIAAVAVSQELGAWIGQGGYYGLLLVAGSVAFRVIFGEGARGTILTRLARVGVHLMGVVLPGLGLAAAGILPRLEAVSRSTRAGGFTPMAWDQDRWTVLYTLDRILSADSQGIWYIGTSVAFLAIAAPFIGRKPHFSWFFLSVTVLTFLLTLRQNWLHEALYVVLPRFEALHGHAHNRILMVLGFSIAMLAGIAADAVARGRLETKSLRMPGGILLLVLLCGLSISWPPGWNDTIETWSAFIVASGILLTVSLLPRMLGWARLLDLRPLLMVILILAIGWDLSLRWWGGDFPGAPRVENAAQILNTHAARVDPNGPGGYLQEQQRRLGPFRYFGFDFAYIAGETNAPRGYRTRFRNPRAHAILVNNRAITLGLEDVQGYDPVQIARYAELITAINGRSQEYHEANILPPGLFSPALPLLNARYVIVPRRVPPGRPDLLHVSQRYPTVYEDGQVRVIERTDALPRAWIVRDTRVVERGAALPLLTSGTVDPRTTALVEGPIEPAADTAAPATIDAATAGPANGDAMTFQVAATEPGVLVISAAYDPGWHAEIHGRPVPVVVADHALMAVPIPAGNAAVTLRYDPPGLRLGLWISGGTAIVVLAALVFAGTAERRCTSRTTPRRETPIRRGRPSGP